MKKGFDGIIPTIQHRGNEVVYEPSKFNLNSLAELFKQDNRSREYVMPVSSYMLAVLKNDKEQIAYHEKRMRVDRFRELKSLIVKLGIKKAKVITWLNKNGRKHSYIDKGYWTFSNYCEWSYLGYGKGEMDSVSLAVELKENKFSITLHVNDSDGYCKDVYTKVLSENISFNSIINQIKYFSKRLENNAY